MTARAEWRTPPKPRTSRKAPLHLRSPGVDWQAIANECRAEYHRRPIGFEKLARWCEATLRARVSATTIRVWAHRDQWKIRPQKNASMLGIAMRTRNYWLRKPDEEAERIARLVHRCEFCGGRISPTVTHDCGRGAA